MNHQKIQISVRLGGLLVVDGLLFGLTDPVKLPSIVIVFAFGLLFATGYQVLRLLLTGLHGWLPLGEGRIKRIAAIVSGLMTILLVMQSIGQLTIRDMTALVPLLAVLYFYFSYNGKRA